MLILSPKSTLLWTAYQRISQLKRVSKYVKYPRSNLKIEKINYGYLNVIKGMPLLIQIDTFDENQPDDPIHRGACQIKVFCDKGAERKIRDEERKALRKRQKCGQYSMLQPQDVKGPLMSTGRKHDIVYYKTMLDTSINPVYFQPEISNSAVETLVS